MSKSLLGGLVSATVGLLMLEQVLKEEKKILKGGKDLWR
jgi:hypothetical protein